MRIWGVAANIDEKTSDKDLARHAAFLGPNGRQHGANRRRDGGPDSAEARLESTDVNASFLNDVWRLVAAMKKEGIYVRVNPLWGPGCRQVHRGGLGA